MGERGIPKAGGLPCIQSTNMSSSEEIVSGHLPGLEDPARSTVERLVDLIFDVLPDVQHDRKWGRLTFTLGSDWHHWICAISATKTAVKLVLHKGALLADASGVLVGEGRYLRSIPFSSPEEINVDVVAPILCEAAARQTEM